MEIKQEILEKGKGMEILMFRVWGEIGNIMFVVEGRG